MSIPRHLALCPSHLFDVSGSLPCQPSNSECSMTVTTTTWLLAFNLTGSTSSAYMMTMTEIKAQCLSDTALRYLGLCWWAQMCCPGGAAFPDSLWVTSSAGHTISCAVPQLVMLAAAISGTALSAWSISFLQVEDVMWKPLELWITQRRWRVHRAAEQVEPGADTW